VTDALARTELTALRQRISVLCPGVPPESVRSAAEARRVLAERATEQVGFLQFINLHRSFPKVAALVKSRRVARAAAALLGVERVCLYQDCAFLKSPEDGPTNWHSDLNMVRSPRSAR
jgi:hypothetical protein